MLKFFLKPENANMKKFFKPGKAKNWILAIATSALILTSHLSSAEIYQHKGFDIFAWLSKNDPEKQLKNNLHCLAYNIYFEARSESETGKYAVAHVTRNRVLSDRFPDTYCDVVKQGYVRGRNDCHFSWYCDGKSDKIDDYREYDHALKIASDVLSGSSYDVSNGSTHYHATYTYPWWARVDTMIKVLRIDNHIFYREVY